MNEAAELFTMIDLSGTHISKLNDEDLRELVFRLCGAELQKNRLPLASVTAGGNQTAPDGGIDVRVGSLINACLDFIPRSPTGFQVKCEDMPAGEIRNEMRPKGTVRPAIAELIASHGAYIIVSSKGSLADEALRRRREAMREAVNDVPQAATLHVDFYDRDRLAHWARCYPGVEMWLRERIGEPLSGWQGYGNWAGDKVSGPYLKDDAGRLLSKTTGNSEAMSVEVGINTIRRRIEQPGQVVRLIGLSGLGKTRLVQALFEPDVGTAPLDRALAAYTDQAHSPQPSARDLMRRLGANGRRTIVIVDNCNPEMHRALTQIVEANISCLSLLTVEYDMTDDEPEETHVFELTSSSSGVLEQIVTRLAPHVTQVDRARIAEFSGGNARVALALARTVQKGQTLGTFNDADLFNRLFIQRNNEPNEVLLRAAEVCSLVYSFDGDDLDTSDAEIPILAALVDLLPSELFRQVAELKRRDLVQQRSNWRAVLPHALANRLAKQALKHVPSSSVIAAFQAHKRLLTSFSRRLGYLHDCERACLIAKQWILDGDWLAKPAALNALGQTLFFNLAPLVPEQALTAIETTLNGDQCVHLPILHSQHRWSSLVRSLAYEPELFDRSAFVLLRWSESEESNTRTSTDIWKELFHVHLSGTLALPQQRIGFLRRILSSGTPRQKELALEALATMLKTSGFTSSHSFSFGARPRDFGWEPESKEDMHTWYGGVFELIHELVQADLSYRGSLRPAVARQLSFLIVNLDMLQEVTSLIKTLTGAEGWPNGWAAIRTSLQRDRKRISVDQLEKLIELEGYLRPRTLKQQVFAYVLAGTYGHLDPANDENYDGDRQQHVHERVSAKVEALAREVVADEFMLQEILPDLLSHFQGQQHVFGKGLAMFSPDIATRWAQLRTAFSQVEASRRDIRLLSGFLEGAKLRDPGAADRFLDAALGDTLLAEYFPWLEGSLLDDVAGQRLLVALNSNAAPVSHYRGMFTHSRCGGMSSEMYRAVLLKLAGLPGGIQVAIDAISLEFFRCLQDHPAQDRDLVTLGRELLGMFNFDVRDENFSFSINEVAMVCLNGSEAEDVATTVCKRFAAALSDYQNGADSLGEFASTLFKLHPAIALDAFLCSSPACLRDSSLIWSMTTQRGVVNNASPEALLRWVSADPVVRAPLLAPEINILGKDGQGLATWSPVASQLLAIAPNKAAVLAGFSQHFEPSIWSGSLANVLRPYQELTQQLLNDPDSEVAKWAKESLAALNYSAVSDLRTERRRDESFE